MSQSEQRTESGQRAERALLGSGVEHTIVRHRRFGSLEEAAREWGVGPADIVKTLVVRRGEDDYLFVLVPGGREISWPKLRAHLGVSRVSMPDAATALAVTGYERGTITPFGSTTPWPVVADATILEPAGRSICLGAGAHGRTARMPAAAALEALGATVADVTSEVG